MGQKNSMGSVVIPGIILGMKHRWCDGHSGLNISGFPPAVHPDKFETGHLRPRTLQCDNINFSLRQPYRSSSPQKRKPFLGRKQVPCCDLKPSLSSGFSGGKLQRRGEEHVSPMRLALNLVHLLHFLASSHFSKHFYSRPV